jgi:hypothetical protein
MQGIFFAQKQKQDRWNPSMRGNNQSSYITILPQNRQKFISGFPFDQVFY